MKAQIYVLISAAPHLCTMHESSLDLQNDDEASKRLATGVWGGWRAGDWCVYKVYVMYGNVRIEDWREGCATVEAGVVG
jgi:hypothetical protein